MGFFQDNQGALASAGISAATAISTNIANRRNNKKINKLNLKYNREMYDRQLEDNRENWVIQNEYNSPRAQMQRLQEAGLNPNLVYDKGANAQGGAISSTGAHEYKANPHQVQLAGDSINNYIDTKAKRAQIDLVQEQVKLAKQEQIWKAIQASKTLIDSKMANFDLKMKENLAENTMAFAQENLRKLQTENYFRMGKEQAELNLLEIEQFYKLDRYKYLTEYEKKQLEQNIEKSGYQNTILRIQSELAEKGVMPNDPAYVRIMSQLSDEILSDPKVGGLIAAGQIPTFIINILKSLKTK